MFKIDFHNHFYPQPYLAELEKGETWVGLQKNEAGQSLIIYSGDYNIIVPEHYDPEARLEAMAAAGIDMQVLTLTTPGVHVESVAKGIALAQLINDVFAIFEL